MDVFTEVKLDDQVYILEPVKAEDVVAGDTVVHFYDNKRVLAFWMGLAETKNDFGTWYGRARAYAEQTDDGNFETFHVRHADDDDEYGYLVSAPQFEKTEDHSLYKVV